MICLGFYEWKVKTDGILHHGLFQKSRNFPLTLVCLFCEGLAFMGANAYLASEISALFAADPVMTGINYGVAWLSAAASSVVAGAICTATKKVRSITLTGFIMFTIFFALMASAGAQSREEVWAYPVFLGLGLGVVTSTLVTTAQLSTPPELIASATGIIIGIRALGGSVGIPIYTAVYNNQYSRGFGAVASAATQAGLSADTAQEFAQILMQTSGNSSAVAFLPGITPEIINAGSVARLDSIALAYRYIWITGIPFMLMATTASYFIVDHKEEFNHRVDTPLPS
ncbi:hypothetical protein FJTKL_11767 [Diaporthe vaccinii]|uniref:Major facilitator superfamily (MFS) profile domain-containing protein n=1 Tax=Diaporthe vaccinii TaxID=105482 RepID=A0ABR4EF60_9PEZI